MTDARPPIALELRQFLNLPVEDRPPLLGVPGQAAIAAGGLTLLAGKAGLGKTTLIVDAIFHFASGRDWLNFTTARPLNVLVIENEGPLQMFQEKLAAKLKVWPHDLQGQIHVQTGAWGWFSFADLALHADIKQYLEDNQIDLVVGDPIGTLGMEGVGSPEDTRNFVKLLVPLGLLTTRAFLFPAHFTKEPRKDEIDQISGAWGGHLDTLMVLKSTGRKDELRLSFPKLRWWNTAPPAPLILGKVYNTQSFEILRHEGDTDDPLEDRIAHLLNDGTWRTTSEIAHRETGVGARQADVKKTLEARPEMFRWEGGADHAKSARAIVWQLIPTIGTSTTQNPASTQRNNSSQHNGTSRTSTTRQPAQELIPHPRDESDEYQNQTPDAGEDTRPHADPLKGGGGTSTTASTHQLIPATGRVHPDQDLDQLFGAAPTDEASRSSFENFGESA